MYEELQAILITEGYKLGLSAVVLLVVYLLYNSFMGFLRKKGKELGLEPHIMNILKLVARTVGIVAVSTAIMSIFEISSDLFVGASALVGAALGFGSSQTINNVVAGFYVLISQPFKVKDYVKIGDLEGQVEEIAINYTSLYTPTFNLLKVPNTQVTSSKILNLTHEGVIKYTFTISFGHEYTELDITHKVIEPAIAEFCNTYCNMDLRSPEAYLESANRLEKVYLFRIFIPKGEAKVLYTLQPELIECVIRHFDKLKTGQ